MTDEPRSIELEIEVPGTPEEVWAAIATGPGISSWYVPHEVEERAGGAASASFGDSPEMRADGRVAAWEPPHRFVVDGGDPEVGLVFEWLVEARSGGTCIVRLVNSGFGRGGEWDDQFDAMTEGWLVFLSNLRLHLTHHRGEAAHTRLPMTYVPSDADTAWEALTDRLGIPAAAAPGDRIEIDTGAAGRFVATVDEITTPDDRPRSGRYLLRVESPAPGTAFIGAESHGEMCGVSAWTYLYGPDAVDVSGPLSAFFDEAHAAVAASFAPD